MGRLRVLAALAFLCVIVAAPPLGSSSLLNVRVTPPVTFAPGFLTVHVTVQPTPENRLLEVIAESDDYYRRSEVSLDGERAARMNVFELKDLPSGMYEVRTVLLGPTGELASAMTLARVAAVGGR
jgi:hypothetical protein